VLLDKKYFLQYIELEIDEKIIKRFYKVLGKNTRNKGIDDMKSDIISHLNILEQENDFIFIENRNTVSDFFDNIKFED
jgi:hypothetical protein